jgi:hypothetical protein
MLATALRERRATHESGHAVGCLVLGLPIISVTIEDNGAYLHRGYYRQQRGLATECLCIMSLAGAEAERLFFPDADDFGDAIDLKMIRGYLEPKSELEFIAEIERLRAAAGRLVVSERAKIEVIAAALLKSGTLTGDQIIELAMTETKVSASLSRA